VLVEYSWQKYCAMSSACVDAFLFVVMGCGEQVGSVRAAGG
jgi:hypothetical protein